MSHAQPLEREFGFLVDPISGKFSSGRITPLTDHADRLKWFKESSNRDGYYYPPEVTSYRLDVLTGVKEMIARSDRPAIIHKLPASHQLELKSPIDTSNTTCSDATLIINVLAYLYGTRLQLPDFGFDGRVPNKPNNNISISQETCLDFLGHTYDWWQSKSPQIRTRFINILYVLNRARCLEWEWEQFAQQYMVFDAIYKLDSTLNSAASQATTHRNRFDVLLSKYGIPAGEPALLDRLSRARNELFHEALWVGSTIGFGSADQNAIYFPQHLSRLNSRLICGLVGYKNAYLQSAWWAMGTFSFNRQP